MKITFKIMLLLLIILDLGYTFNQQYIRPIYGDISQLVVPTKEKGYYHVLLDPIGYNTLIKKESYPNPNRYFAHITTQKYFLNVPIFLQNFVSPIKSVYLSIALIQTITQLLIIYLLCILISGSFWFFRKDFLISALILSTFFQSNGYNKSMGIIDQSSIYTIFYGLSMALLLIFFIPFFRELYWGKKIEFSFFQKLVLFLFIPVITLNGPLVPGVILIVCPLVLFMLWLNYFKTNNNESFFKRVIESIKEISTPVLIFFVTACIFSLYSLYVGSTNNLNLSSSPSLLERYLRIPKGIYHILTQKPGYLLLLILITINTIILRNKNFDIERLKILRLFSWIGVFALGYILLLPLGGYREYRNNVLRYDTIIPITLALFYFAASSSLFIIKQLKQSKKYAYIAILILIMLAFTNADNMAAETNSCEIEGIMQLINSNDSVVGVNVDCPIMDWIKCPNLDKNKLDCDLLVRWNILSETKTYYFVEE